MINTTTHYYYQTHLSSFISPKPSITHASSSSPGFFLFFFSSSPSPLRTLLPLVFFSFFFLLLLLPRPSRTLLPLIFFFFFFFSSLTSPAMALTGDGLNHHPKPRRLLFFFCSSFCLSLFFRFLPFSLLSFFFFRNSYILDGTCIY
jgi:hypothetical protein